MKRYYKGVKCKSRDLFCHLNTGIELLIKRFAYEFTIEGKTHWYIDYRKSTIRKNNSLLYIFPHSHGDRKVIFSLNSLWEYSSQPLLYDMWYKLFITKFPTKLESHILDSDW